MDGIVLLIITIILAKTKSNWGGYGVSGDFFTSDSHPRLINAMNIHGGVSNEDQKL